MAWEDEEDNADGERGEVARRGMLAFTDAWLPPPRPSSTVLHPSSPPPPPSPLSRASSRPHACTSAGRVPCSSPGGGVGAGARCRPPFWIDGFGGSTGGGGVGRNLYEYFTFIPPLTLTTDRERGVVMVAMSERGCWSRPWLTSSGHAPSAPAPSSASSTISLSTPTSTQVQGHYRPAT